MFVYIWKDAQGAPFYVGFTSSMRRTNPKNSPKRNWLCMRKLEEIGREHVVVEIRFVESIVDGQEMERKLIAEYGRIQTNTGPLTNLMPGGEGAKLMPEHIKQKRREAMLDPSNPIRSPEAIAKRKAAQKRRMNDPATKALYAGENNPAKKEEVRAKIKAKWQDPEFKAMMSAERTGKKKNLSEEARAKLSARLAANSAMKKWGELNGKDAEFDAKRIEGIRAAQDKRREKMSDPAALAQRKARLKATLSSPEFAAKRAQWDTPEYRAKLSAAKRKYWEMRKADSNQA